MRTELAYRNEIKSYCEALISITADDDEVMLPIETP